MCWGVRVAAALAVHWKGKGLRVAPMVTTMMMVMRMIQWLVLLLRAWPQGALEAQRQKGAADEEELQKLRDQIADLQRRLAEAEGAAKDSAQSASGDTPLGLLGACCWAPAGAGGLRSVQGRML